MLSIRRSTSKQTFGLRAEGRTGSQCMSRSRATREEARKGQGDDDSSAAAVAAAATLAGADDDGDDDLNAMHPAEAAPRCAAS
jgi:hypothetical protein